MKDIINKSGDLRTEYHINENFPLSIHIIKVYENKSIYPHYHDNFEILYIKTGTVTVRIGNHIFSGEKDDIFFSNKFQVHSATSDEIEKSEVYAIVFDLKMIEALNHNLLYDSLLKPLFSGTVQFPEKINKNSILYEKLFNSLQYIIDEYYRMEKGYELFVKTEIERLFAIIIRYSEQALDHQSSILSSPDKKIVEGTWQYINEHYARTISLDQIASHLNINKHYYCRLIKKITGKTFSSLLNMYRIQHAKDMVETTLFSIKDIIELTGYNNQSYFNKMFITYTGSTPLQIRKKALNQVE